MNNENSNGIYEEFKISNNHRAYIARWLVEQDPSLEKYLKLKKTNY